MFQRTFHDRGIANTLWKRSRWTRQDRKPSPIPTKKKKADPLLRGAVLGAITDFWKKESRQDGKREGRSSDSYNGPERRFNR